MNKLATPFIPNIGKELPTSSISDTVSTLSENTIDSESSNSKNDTKLVFDIFNKKTKSNSPTKKHNKKKTATTKVNLQKVSLNKNISHENTIMDWATPNINKLSNTNLQDKLHVQIPTHNSLDPKLQITKRSPHISKTKLKSENQGVYMKVQLHKARASAARKTHKPTTLSRYERLPAAEVTCASAQLVTNLPDTSNEKRDNTSITTDTIVDLQVPPYARQLQATTSVITKPRKWNDHYISDTSSCLSSESTISTCNNSADSMISILTNSVDTTATTLYDMFTSNKKKGTIKRKVAKHQHVNSVANSESGHHTTSVRTTDAAVPSNSSPPLACRAAPTGIS